MADDVKITRRKITDYQPDPNNANLGSERGLGMIEDSLRKVGAGRSLVADAHDVLAAGNKTQEAAVNAGLTEVVEIESDGHVLVVHKRRDYDLSDPVGQARQYAYYDNRAQQISLAWDAQQIAADIAAGLDVGAMFTPGELADIGVMSGEPPPDPGAQIDKAAELQQVWQVQRGDVWECGKHRVLCGDSTNAEDVARVMAGDRALLLFTSPPYADQREYGGSDLSIENLVQFVPLFASYADYQCINLGLKRVNNEIVEYWNEYIMAARTAGLKLLSWNVWDKINATSVRSQTAMFAIQHEWIFVFGYEPAELNRTVAKSPESIKRARYYRRNEDGKPVTTRRQVDGSVKNTPIGEVFDKKNMGTVITCYAEMERTVDHPAKYPPELPTAFIEAMTDCDDIVVDPFLGSGTTMVAAQQLGRVCRGIEIEPKYVSVTLDRMHRMGLDPRCA